MCPPAFRVSDSEASWDAREASDRELIARVIGPDSEHLPKRSLRALTTMHPQELRSCGLGPLAVHQLLAVAELARRLGEEVFEIGASFKSSYDIYAHFRERLAAERVEQFIAVVLDNKHRKIRDVVVSKGSLTSSIIHPRDVFSEVIRDSAAAVVFVHNHPSGDPTPSREDLEITRRLREVGELIGVRVLDHLVIGHGRYVSFVDDGYW